MSALLFLAVALVVSAVGSSILWLRARKPTSLQSSIEAFTREMQALSPDADDQHGRQTPRRTRDGF